MPHTLRSFAPFGQYDHFTTISLSILCDVENVFVSAHALYENRFFFFTKSPKNSKAIVVSVSKCHKLFIGRFQVSLDLHLSS